MQAVSRRIESDIDGARLRKRVLQPVGHVVDKATPGEIFKNVAGTQGELLYQSMPISRRTLLKAMVTAGATAVTGGGAYSYVYARDALELTRATLPVTGLPEGLSGLRVGLITDVHRSRWVTQTTIDRAVRLLMSERPDLIVLGGDYISFFDPEYIEPAAEALAPLSAPFGVFGVLGNHDDDRDMPAALEARGVEMLKDARTRLSIRNESLELAGIRFWTRRATDIANVVKDARGPVILLAHDPRRLVEAAALNIPLVLSGHTHGGQIILPLLGAPAARQFPILSGRARHATTTIFVSRGVGTVYLPLRVSCPPEVALLTLEATSLTGIV